MIKDKVILLGGNMLKGYKILSSLILALFCTFVLSFGYIIGENPLVSSDNIMSVIIFILLIKLFYEALKCNELRVYIISILPSFILSAAMCVGSEFVSEGKVSLGSPVIYLNILGLMIVFAALLILLFMNLSIINEWLKKISSIRIFNNINPGMKTIVIFTIIFLICWIPLYLAVFPGNFTYDGPIQIEQVFGEGQLNQHHPIVHTLFLSGCVYIGNLLFGSYAVGLAIYSWLQAIIVAISFAYMCNFMLKWKVPKIVVILSMIFLAFNPIIQLFVFTTAKDVPFGSFMLFLAIFTIELITEPEKFYNSKLLMIRYVLTVLLMSFMRKQGIYVFILLVPLLIWIQRKYWVKTVIISVVSIICVFSFFGPIASSMNALPSPSTEALSVPFQQIARVMNINPDSVTEEEKEVVYKFISEDALKGYIPEISDPVKNNVNEEELENNKGEFAKIWLKLGAKNINLYIQSFLYGTVGYFYPSVDTIHQWSVMMNPYTSGSVVILSNPILPSYHNLLYNIGHTFFKEIPIASTLVCEALPFWILVISVAVLIYKRNYSMLIIMFFMFVFWSSLLLGPVVCIRYIYPLFICIPLMISMPYFKVSSNKNV